MFSGTWFGRPGSFSQSQQAGSIFDCFAAIEVDVGDKTLLELEVDLETDGVVPPDPVWPVLIAEAILMKTASEQVPSLHRVAPRYLGLVTSSNF